MRVVFEYSQDKMKENQKNKKNLKKTKPTLNGTEEK